MWAVWMIIAVAVGGAVSLTTTAVLTVVYFERRRHRRLMERHRLDRNTSQMHRHHLSVTDLDISSLPRPAKSFWHGYQRPRSESIRFYATIPSQDEIRTFPEGTITESVVDGAHCQPEGSHQWLAPSKSGRLKRKKKIAKVSTSLPVAKSPMSAITEATEATESGIGIPEPVELPAHITPRMTPEKTMPVSVKVVRDQTSIDSVLVAPEPLAVLRVNHGVVVKSRSISAGSIVAPPNIPLPPIPDTIPYDPQRQASLSRSKSDISLHRRSASAVSQSSKPKNGFCEFRFELTGEDLVRKSDKTISKPIQPSFRFPQPEIEQDPEETLKTIDASTWNLPKSLRTSRPITPTPSAPNSEPGSRSISMLDYDAIFSAGSSLNNSPTKPYEGALSRPVSALSVSSTDMFRLSVIGSKVPESPRTVGHKRQNCVRIKNLTPIDNKKRLSSQLGRLTEAEEDDGSILLPSPSRVGQSQSASTSDSSLRVNFEAGNEESLSVPVIKQPQALSLRVRHPGWTSIKDKNRQPRPLPVPGNAVKNDQTTHSDSIDTSTRQTPADVLPTVLEAIQTSGTNTPISPVSLTRIFSPDSPQRRPTQIQGPRNAPPLSLRVRNQTRAGSPLRRKSSDSERVNKQHLHHHHHPHHQRDQDRPHKPSDTYLRRSLTILKSMTLPETLPTSASVSASAPSSAPVPTTIKLSEHHQATLPIARTPSSRYADSPIIRVPKNRLRSNTVAGHPGERTRASSPPQQQRRDFLAVQTGTPAQIPMLATPGRLRYSPSSISIWEDDSVRGDSPEPQVPTAVSSQTHTQQSSQWAATTTQSASPSENNPPPPHYQSQPPTHPSSPRYSPVKSHRAHFDKLSISSTSTSYHRNMSTQQYHQQQFHQHSQQQQQTQIQRESLWGVRQSTDVGMGRAVGVGSVAGGGGGGSGNGSGGGNTRSPGEQKRFGSGGNVNGGSPSPRLKGLGLGLGNAVPVPAGLRISTQTQTRTQTQSTTSSREHRGTTRMRSHTVSVAPKSMGQSPSQSPSPSEGIGLGLKFGERSMAYTVNEVGMGRSR